MESFLIKLFSSKARPMVILRYILAAAIAFMGLARLRLIIMMLTSPTSYQQRDILQEYLLAKALVSGVNPYLPLNKLAEMYIGKFDFLTHPAPYPPFVALFSTPLLAFNINQAIIVWLSIELSCLLAIAGMVTILWKGKLNWKPAIFIVLVLLSWYPVMVDLLYGQMTILLTTILLAGLLVWRGNKKILAGVLVGLSVALKMFTWPLIVYFALKKDWRTFISSCITVVSLNSLALFVMGVGPFSDYYLKVTMQVSAIYHSFLKNYSLWSIGYRIFEGTRPIGSDYISAPPLINLPRLAPLVSAGLAAAFLVIGLIWAIKSRSADLAYAIMVCVIVGVSPISWDHYYIMIVISIAILLLNLSRHAYPTWQTSIFIVITALLYLFNEYIAVIIFSLNGGTVALQANGNVITFLSSLLETLPMIQLVILTFLLWRSGESEQASGNRKDAAIPQAATASQ